MDRKPNELEWDQIMKLVQEIDEEDPYEAFAEMLADALEYEESNGNLHDAFYDLHSFLFRAKWRLRGNREERPFNMVSEVDNFIRITNYDYKTYKWGKKLCNDFVSNDIIDVPIKALSNKQLTALRSRMENHVHA